MLHKGLVLQNMPCDCGVFCFFLAKLAVYAISFTRPPSFVYFVTGATGLLGAHFCKHLCRSGLPVRALRRATSQMPARTRELDIEWVTGEITDYAVLQKALEGVKVVVHAAARVSFDPRYLNSLLETNVQGTATLVNAMLASPEKPRLIHLSSVAALGKAAPGREKLDEDAKWDETQKANPYALSKYLAELEVHRAFAEGLRGFILNPSVVLGPGTPGRSSMQLQDYVKGGLPFYTPGALPYVDARDVVDFSQALLALSEEETQGERYVLSADEVSLYDFFQRLAEKLNAKAPTRKIPLSLLAWFVRLEWLRARLTGSEQRFTLTQVRARAAGVQYNGEKVSTLLGKKYRSLEESLDFFTAR